MALIQTDITRETRRRLTWAAQRGAPGGFARAAVVGCFGVMALAFALPDATPAAIAIAVLFYAVAARLAGRSLRRAYPHDRLGLCNHVTLTRLVLTCALLAPFLASSAPSWAFFTVAAVALALDGVDGERVFSAGSDVPDEFEVALAQGAHRVVGEDVMTNVTEQNFVPAFGVRIFEDREEAAAVEGVIGEGGSGPVENRGRDIREGDEGFVRGHRGFQSWVSHEKGNAEIGRAHV